MVKLYSFKIDLDTLDWIKLKCRDEIIIPIPYTYPNSLSIITYTSRIFFTELRN